jgi:excisionase family DNA binding protein
MMIYGDTIRVKGGKGMAEQSDQVFTVAEAAKYLKVHEQTIYKLLRSGKLKGAKVGKDWRIHKDILDEFLKKGGN